MNASSSDGLPPQSELLPTSASGVSDHTAPESPVKPKAEELFQAVVYRLFAYEIGNEVDLDRAVTLLGEEQSRTEGFSTNRRQPEFFGYRPRPLRVVRSVGEFRIGDYSSHRLIELTVWALGVISVEWKIILQDVSLDELAQIHLDLDKDQQLESEARQQVNTLVKTLAQAISVPTGHGVVEEYTVFDLQNFPGSTLNTSDFLARYGLAVARILRLFDSSVDLSTELIDDALFHRFRVTTRDLTIIDWGAAFVTGADTKNVRELIEFVQVELLERRHLDSLFDIWLDNAYDLYDKTEREFEAHRNSRYRWLDTLKRTWFATLYQVGLARADHDDVEEDLACIGKLSVDAQKLIDSSENAIDLLGDPSLHRIYQLCADRFSFSPLSKSVRDKGTQLDNIYKMMHERKEHGRGVFLELVVIVLILIEVIHSFVH